MTKKKNNNIHKSPSPIIRSLFILGVIVIGVVMYSLVRQNLMQKSDIFVVEEPGPSAAVVNCGLRDFSVENSCGSNGLDRYNTAFFICADGTEPNIFRNKISCMSIDDWYRQGTMLCRNHCLVPTPTPSPVIVPKPSTSLPRPSKIPSPSPSPRFCPQVSGKCYAKINKDGNMCATYTDGCQKLELCNPDPAYQGRSCPDPQ